jgi:23S rRNA (guanosine2251-2'-O)-methyltransferase
MKIYGFHTVRAILSASGAKGVSRIFVSDRQDVRMQEILHLASQRKVPVEVRPRKDLDAWAGEGVHQGIVAEFIGQVNFSETDLDQLLERDEQPRLLLALDGIQDPHNIGAILRSAEVFQVGACISPRDRAGDLTPVARKVASGAAELIPFIRVTNLVRTLKNLQDNDYWVVGMAGEGSSNLYDFKPPQKVCLVVGAEGEGLRRLTRETCDELCHIPMFGSIESLNVSVATGIALSVIRNAQGR